jgi:soluble lytic murein transglycosylase
MTPPAASPATRRRGQAARRRTVRRRRSLGLVVGAAVLVIGAVISVVGLPLAREAINELSLPLTNAAIIRQQASEKHLDPALIAAVIYAETKFDPRPSSAGAEGLMQLMPQTAEFLAHRSGGVDFHVSDLATPRVNIAYGSYYLRYLIDHYGGNIVDALAAYNAGEANVDRWVARARARGHPLTVQEIPFDQTRLYVQKVLTEQRDYRRVYAKELGYR